MSSMTSLRDLARRALGAHLTGEPMKVTPAEFHALKSMTEAEWDKAVLAECGEFDVSPAGLRSVAVEVDSGSSTEGAG